MQCANIVQKYEFKILYRLEVNIFKSTMPKFIYVYS